LKLVAAIVIALASGCLLPAYDNVAADAKTSDGTLGVCGNSPAGTDPANVCGGYQCNGTGDCVTQCSATSPCKDSHDCVSGVCELRRPLQDAVIGAPELDPVITLTLQKPTLQGNALVLVGSLATTSQMLDVKDSANNVWNRVTLAYPATTMYPTTEIWYAANASPMTSLTVTLTQPRGTVLHVMEWPTVRRLAPLDRMGVDAGAVGTSGTTGSLTTTLDKVLVVGSIGIYVNGIATLKTQGFTSLRVSSDGYLHNDVAYQIGGAGTYQASYTFSASTNYTGVIASFILD
jgi:hypothetical protein